MQLRNSVRKTIIFKIKSMKTNGGKDGQPIQKLQPIFLEHGNELIKKMNFKMCLLVGSMCVLYQPTFPLM